MNMRNLVIAFFFLFLLASIPIGVALIKQQVDLTSQASSQKSTHIEIISAEVKDLRTKSNQVKIRLFFAPNAENIFPTNFRISNRLTILDQVPEMPFLRNDQEVDWQLESNPGPKTVFAQFKVDNAWTQPISASIILDSP